ncbi:hypothetical protein BT69DRAFT_668321 [Atractiella rhizophila]|nr:hypothetical protein BT69DRAFT_668321 [Atractiella rhizophila]
MVAAGDSVDVFLYNVAHNGDYEAVSTHQTHTKTSSFSTSWSPDSMYYAVASQAGFITVWDVRSTKSLAILNTSQRGAAGAARVVKFGPSSEKMMLAFSEHRNFIHVVDARNFEYGQRLEVPVPYPWTAEPAPQARSSSRRFERPLRRHQSHSNGLLSPPTANRERPPVSRSSSRGPHAVPTNGPMSSSQRNYLRLSSNSSNSSPTLVPERWTNPVFSWEEDLPAPVQPGHNPFPPPDLYSPNVVAGPLAIPRQEQQERDITRPYNLSAQEANIAFREYLTQAVYTQAYDLEIFENQAQSLTPSHPRLIHPMTPFSVLFQNPSLPPMYSFNHPKLEFTSVSKYGPSLSYCSPLPERPPPFSLTDNINCPPSHPTDLNGICWDPDGDYLYCGGGEWGIAEWKVDSFARGTIAGTVLC